MARAIPRVEHTVLLDPVDATLTIGVGTPAWYTWLERTTSFAFHGVSGHFTARKERRRSGAGSWNAYRKRAGVLRSVSLGRSSELTLDRLNAAAASLAAPVSRIPTDLDGSGAVPATTGAPSSSAQTASLDPEGRPDMAALPLLLTKLYPPPTPRGLVTRPRLVARVQAGLAGKLLLLAAPAGFGKTTLLSDWRASSGGGTLPLAWVALDRDDNDPLRFWRSVLTAFAMLLPECGATALAMLETPQPPPIETILAMWLNRLATLPTDAVLVLDDYHVIDAAPVHQTMTFLLDHLPARVHLVIATRADPPLPLTRWRAQQQLAELRAVDLRFTPAEAASFLQETMALPLTAAEVATIEARTEGWIAGLQFAALAMRDRPNRADFIHAFGGSNRFVVDYLADEVLNRLPTHLQTFVLQTSILDRMCGSLCDAVVLGDPLDPSLGVSGTQRAYSQLVLEELERTNLFLVPLDDERRWYRYHHLFAEVLRQRLLSGAAPALVTRLHQRASGWFARQNLIAEAIPHALAAHDAERAAQLVEQAAPSLFACGQVATVRSWLAALPEGLVHARPRLGLQECWTLAFEAQLQELEVRLHDVLRVIETATELSPEERQALASEVMVLRTRVAFGRNEAPPLSELRQALLDAPPGDLRLRSLVLLALGHAERLHGNTPEASHAYAEANRLAQRAGDTFTAGSALVALAEHHEVRGQLHAAAAAHRQGLRLAIARDGRPLPLAGFFHVGLGKQLREWNDLDAATQHLKQGIALGQQGGMHGIELDGAITLALVFQAQGDVAAVEGVLERAAEIAQTWGQPQIELRVAAFAARLALMQGRVPDAARWAQTNRLGIDDELSEWLEIEYCTLARWQLAEGRADNALRLLARLAKAAEQASRIGRLIEILAVQALASQLQGDTATALSTLARALGLALPEGYVRVFVDEGAPMAALLRAAYTRRMMQDYSARLLAAFPERREARDLRLVQGAGASPLVSSLEPLASLIEPLTDRELEVLRLVVAGHSNRQVADELIVAVGTVKAHLNSIFGKLGVRSRTQAIVRANDLHLV